MGAARIKTDHSLLVRPFVLLRRHLGVLRHLEEAEEEEEEEEVGAAQIKTNQSLLVRPFVLLLRTDHFFILLVLLF